MKAMVYTEYGPPDGLQLKMDNLTSFFLQIDN